MYNKCVNCPKLGISCDGPNFVAMSANDMLEWCKLRKAYLRLSNSDIAEMANMPKGTIDRLFSRYHSDFRWETIRPLTKALVGGDNWGRNACDLETDEEAAERIKNLEEENTKLRDFFMGTDQQHRQDIEATKKEDQEQISFLKAQLKERQLTVRILSIVVAVLMSIILVALIVDRLNSNIGFFWLSGSTHAFADISTDLLMHLIE